MNLKIELRKYGFVTINHLPYITEQVKNVIESWKEFCALPLIVKTLFKYNGDAIRNKDTGYEFKNKTIPATDQKENFHFTLDDLPRITEIAQQHKVDPSLIFNVSSLLKEIIVPICEFTKLLGDQFNLPGLRDELYAGREKWVLRCLHYFPTQVGEIIASQHVDKLGITIYLGETTSGVQYYTRNNKWRNLPVLSDKTVITPNMQMQYKTRGELKALCHRVVANTESARQGRYSIVCFADFLQTPPYNKEKYGRTQNLPPGFNYGMNHKEFSKFFM